MPVQKKHGRYVKKMADAEKNAPYGKSDIEGYISHGAKKHSRRNKQVGVIALCIPENRDHQCSESKDQKGKSDAGSLPKKLSFTGSVVILAAHVLWHQQKHVYYV
jgi:hypothetical protein